jgi:hypothetical protein
MKILKRLILRGKLGKWWIMFRNRRIEDAYISKIAPNTLASVSAAAHPTLPSYTNTTLRHILFIGDVMWEDQQLFPELRRIAALEVLDLRTLLVTQSDETPAATAQRGVENFHPHRAPDLVFLYARPGLLSDEMFDTIRRKWSCPVLGMNLDDRMEFHEGVLSPPRCGYGGWASKFDLNLTSSRLAEEWYRKSGAAARFMPQGFARSPTWTNPPPKNAYQHDISFVGSMKPERAELISKLAHYGLNVAVFGSGWPQAKWLDDPVEVYRSSQLNLGIGTILSAGRITCLKGRDIECPSTGACYLTTYHWELPELFEIGKEILCYRNFAELIEMHAFYSKRPDACLKIARAAHKRAHSEHTWEQRLRCLFKDMGFKTTHT